MDSTPFRRPSKRAVSHTTDRAGWPWTAAASASQRPFWAGVPPGDLSSYSSRPTFKPAVATHRGYESHICVNWLISQQRLIDQLTHSAASSRSSLSVHGRSQWIKGTPLAGRQHPWWLPCRIAINQSRGCAKLTQAGGDEAIQALIAT